MTNVYLAIDVTDEVWRECIKTQTPPEPDDDFTVVYAPPQAQYLHESSLYYWLECIARAINAPTDTPV